MQVVRHATHWRQCLTCNLQESYGTEMQSVMMYCSVICFSNMQAVLKELHYRTAVLGLGQGQSAETSMVVKQVYPCFTLSMASQLFIDCILMCVLAGNK